MAKKYLIIFVGESNSGGQGLNSSAAAAEKGLQVGINHYNNDTGVIEKLNIGKKSNGGNNRLGHDRLGEEDDLHGWELQLANRVRAATFGADTVYLLKAGQGGSTASEWNQATDPYQVTFKARSDSYKGLVQNLTPIIWLSIGINDSLLSTPNTGQAFRDDVMAAIALWRLSWPGAPILISTVTPTYTAQNTNIRSLQGSVSNSYLVDAATVSPGSDINHWDYAGLKAVTDLFIARTLEAIPVSVPSPISYAMANQKTIYIG